MSPQGFSAFSHGDNDPDTAKVLHAEPVPHHKITFIVHRNYPAMSDIALQMDFFMTN